MDYRIYFLDGAGSIGLADWIEADCDEAAVTQARNLKPDMHRCEIWLKNRLVATIDGNGHGQVIPDVSASNGVPSSVPARERP